MNRCCCFLSLDSIPVTASQSVGHAGRCSSMYVNEPDAVVDRLVRDRVALAVSLEGWSFVLNHRLIFTARGSICHRSCEAGDVQGVCWIEPGKSKRLLFAWLPMGYWYGRPSNPCME